MQPIPSSTPPPPPLRCKKNHYTFPSPNPSSPPTIISSNFDSGNIQLVRQINDHQFRLCAVPDDLKSNSKKCWFHFKVKPHKPCITMRFTILNVSVLYSGYQNGLTPRCVCKEEDGEEWRVIPVMYMTHSEEPELIVEYRFEGEGFVYFALTVPFSYYDQIIYLENLDDRMRGREEVFYRREVVGRSTMGFDVYVLSISEKEREGDGGGNEKGSGDDERREEFQKTDQQLQSTIHPSLFPTNQPRPPKIHKPVIFINTRVHPGQTTASHTLNGIISFLTSTDLRAYLLRKLFLFIIIPMSNPDGVFEGNYRMDSTGTNLNRVYNLATPTLYPQIFAIRQLIEYYNEDQRLQFYFDLHGHTSPKNNFIYGNALDNIVSQVESELYCRILDLNCRYFSWKDCCFSERHMSMKDKNEPLSKEGCSRVVVGKITGLVNCFTMEIGIWEVEGEEEVGEVNGREFEWGGMRVEEDQGEDCGVLLRAWRNVGKEMMVSLIDRIDKNPFSRIYTSNFRSLQILRKNLAFEVLNTEQRFKNLDIKAYQKVKFISKNYPEVFTDKIMKKLEFLDNDEEIQNIQWPGNFQGFKGAAKKEKQAQLKQVKSKNLSQSRLEHPVPRKLLKCMSQGEKLEQIPHIPIASTNLSSNISPSISPNVQPTEIQEVKYYQHQFKITQIKIMQRQQDFINMSQQLIREKMAKDKISTRKLLKEFSNHREKDKERERQRAQSDRIEDLHKLRQASPLQVISKDDTMINEIKQRINSKIELRKNNSVLRKGINSNRLRTDQLEQAPDLKIQSDKRLPLQKYSQILSLPKDRVLAMTEPENPMTEKEMLERKIKKIRNFKREILNVKFSDIRKRGSLKLPEIRGVKGGGKKEEFLNLEELRKDIEVVKLISATSYNLLKEQQN